MNFLWTVISYSTRKAPIKLSPDKDFPRKNIYASTLVKVEHVYIFFVLLLFLDTNDL